MAPVPAGAGQAAPPHARQQHRRAHDEPRRITTPTDALRRRDANRASSTTSTTARARPAPDDTVGDRRAARLVLLVVGHGDHGVGLGRGARARNTRGIVQIHQHEIPPAVTQLPRQFSGIGDHGGAITDLPERVRHPELRHGRGQAAGGRGVHQHVGGTARRPHAETACRGWPRGTCRHRRQARPPGRAPTARAAPGHRSQGIGDLQRARAILLADATRRAGGHSASHPMPDRRSTWPARARDLPPPPRRAPPPRRGARDAHADAPGRSATHSAPCRAGRAAMHRPGVERALRARVRRCPPRPRPHRPVVRERRAATASSNRCCARYASAMPNRARVSSGCASSTC